jgi:hypothetical protein
MQYLWLLIGLAIAARQIAIRSGSEREELMH